MQRIGFTLSSTTVMPISFRRRGPQQSAAQPKRNSSLKNRGHAECRRRPINIMIGAGSSSSTTRQQKSGIFLTAQSLDAALCCFCIELGKYRSKGKHSTHCSSQSSGIFLSRSRSAVAVRYEGTGLQQDRWGPSGLQCVLRRLRACGNRGPPGAFVLLLYACYAWSWSRGGVRSN